jgi:hypothetical protein
MINSVYPLTTVCPPTADDRAGSWPGAGVARAFARAAESGRLNLPLPGGGRTRKRWAVLAQLGEEEAHGRRVADLTVYLRQHHAERDLAELGALVADSGIAW